MSKKCVYCKSDVPDSRSMEICDRCGVGVWGPKQWANIKNETDAAQERGDLNFNSGECLDKKKFA
ncbi:MAG: hypothetical protein WC812_04000 [Candidatus Pacearchaeota archaeon]|jgi:hypothetical protein